MFSSLCNATDQSVTFKIKLVLFSFDNQFYLKRKSFRNQMKHNKDLVSLYMKTLRGMSKFLHR